MKTTTTIAIIGIAAAPLVLAGCAGTPAPTQTVTQSATVTVTPTPAATPTEEPTPTATKSASATPTAAPEPTKTKAAKADPEPAAVKVANGVGMNYQKAQDLWRSQGLVVLPAEDASGEDRIPFLDSGWYVVDQDPPAGTVTEDGTVTASVLKYSD